MVVGVAYSTYEYVPKCVRFVVEIDPIIGNYRND